MPYMEHLGFVSFIQVVVEKTWLKSHCLSKSALFLFHLSTLKMSNSGGLLVAEESAALDAWGAWGAWGASLCSAAAQRRLALSSGDAFWRFGDQGKICRKSIIGGFPWSWGYPNGWMVYVW